MTRCTRTFTTMHRMIKFMLKELMKRTMKQTIDKSKRNLTRMLNCRNHPLKKKLKFTTKLRSLTRMPRHILRL